MLKIIWLLLSIILNFIIFSRIPKNDGLVSMATKTNLLGSPNSTEKFLNNFTSILIFFYFSIALVENT